MIWKMNNETKQVSCVAVARGHTHAILTVAFPRYVVLWCGTCIVGFYDNQYYNPKENLRLVFM